MTERIALTLLLFIGVAVVTLPAAFVAESAGFSGITVGIAAVVGWVGTAFAAPRVWANSARYPVARRVMVVPAGLLAMAATGYVLAPLGLDLDALSHLHAPLSPLTGLWAITQEGIGLVVGYGAMFAATALVLGAPRGEGGGQDAY